MSQHHDIATSGLSLNDILSSEASNTFEDEVSFMQQSTAFPITTSSASSSSSSPTTKSSLSSVAAATTTKAVTSQRSVSKQYAWTNPTSDDVAKNFFLCFHHDELAGHGKIQTYQFKCCAHPTKLFDKNLTGKMFQAPHQNQNTINSSWIDPTKNRLCAFIKKVNESAKTSKMKKVVDKACACDRYCKEHEEADKDALNTRDLYYFFCGPVVYEIECVVVVLSIPTWKFETDYKTMNALSKLDAVKLERMYQEHGQRGETAVVKGAYGREYIYNFDAMTQMNAKSKRKRKIERVILAGVDTTVPPFNNGSMKNWIVSASEVAGGSPAMPSVPSPNSVSKQEKQRPPSPSSSQRPREPTVDPSHDTAHYKEVLGKAEQEGQEARQKREAALAEEQDRQKKLIEEKLAARKRAVGTDSPSSNNNDNNNSSTPSLPQWLQDLEKPENGGIPRDILTILHDQRIDENTFLLLSAADLSTLGIPLGPRLALMKVVAERNSNGGGTARPNTAGSSSANDFSSASPLVRPSTASNFDFNYFADPSSMQSNLASTNLNSSIATTDQQHPSWASDPAVCELMNTLYQKFHRTIVIDPSDVELFGIIASGGFGSVYEGRIGGSKPVAIKMFENVKDGIDESEICHKLFHRNIVQLVGVSVYCPQRRLLSPTSSSSAPPKLLMLMELADGSLSSILSQRASTLDWEIVERFTLQIAQGLAYLHQNNVLHLDIKPGNVLCLHNNSVLKLTDFGVSKHKRSIEHTSTMVSRVAGSMCYMPPEQRTSLSVSARNDSFSFGVMLFFMVTGLNPVEVVAASNRLTFNPEETPKMLLQALDDGGARTGCPEFLSALCRKCLQKEPKDRPADGSEILKIVQEGLVHTNELVRGVSTKTGDESTKSNSADQYCPPTKTEVVDGVYDFD